MFCRHFLPPPLFPLLSFLLFSICWSANEPQRRSFTIDYAHNVFLKDGLPFRYISGEIHYFRISFSKFYLSWVTDERFHWVRGGFPCFSAAFLTPPPLRLHIHPSLWEDRLFRVRAAGLNAVQLYIPWNFHEQEIGRFNFGGDRNISRFIRIAQQNELYVLIRMGPYVCAELEFGGLPWWLIKDQAKVRLRSSETTYLRHVHRWLAALFWKMSTEVCPFATTITCDGFATSSEKHSAKTSYCTQVGRTDGPTEKMLSCGAIEGTFATVDFGTQQTEANVKEMFKLQRKYSKGGPPVNSEFYTTWFSMWGDKSMVRQEIGPVLKTMDYMWAENASFSLYMIHGGTSFGFWSGRETNGPVTTSYDYAAPIDEAGQITPLFGAIRNWIGAKKDWPNPPLPLPKNRTGVSIQNVFAVKLGDFIALTNSSSLSSSDSRQRCIHSSDGPLNFEAFYRDHGFVWYSASLETDGKTLEVPELRDHAYVFLDGIFQGNLSVNDKTGGQMKMELKGGGKRGQRMDILVENIGRLTYPLTKTDPKGLFSPPFIDGKVISKRWVQCGVNLDNVYAEIEKRMAKSKNRKKPNDTIRSALLHEPTIFVAKFSTAHIDWAQMHTFLDSRGWGHGVALANGFNLGRYWPTQGPQLTLFVPGAVMKEQNLVVLIELEGRQKDDSFIHFVSDPKFTWTQKRDALSDFEGNFWLIGRLSDQKRNGRSDNLEGEGQKRNGRSDNLDGEGQKRNGRSDNLDGEGQKRNGRSDNLDGEEINFFAHF